MSKRRLSPSSYSPSQIKFDIKKTKESSTVDDAPKLELGLVPMSQILEKYNLNNDVLSLLYQSKQGCDKPEYSITKSLGAGVYGRVSGITVKDEMNITAADTFIKTKQYVVKESKLQIPLFICVLTDSIKIKKMFIDNQEALSDDNDTDDLIATILYEQLYFIFLNKYRSKITNNQDVSNNFKSMNEMLDFLKNLKITTNIKYIRQFNKMTDEKLLYEVTHGQGIKIPNLCRIRSNVVYDNDGISHQLSPGDYVCNNNITETIISAILSNDVKLNKIPFFVESMEVGICQEMVNIMERVDGSVYNLFDSTKEPTINKDDKTLRNIIVQILIAIYYLQDVYKINHNDLHLKNILYVDAGENKTYKKFYELKGKMYSTDCRYLVKLADFGLSAKYSRPKVIPIDVYNLKIQTVPNYYDPSYDVFTFIGSLFLGMLVNRKDQERIPQIWYDIAESVISQYPDLLSKKEKLYKESVEEFAKNNVIEKTNLTAAEIENNAKRNTVRQILSILFDISTWRPISSMTYNPDFDVLKVIDAIKPTTP